MSLFLIILAAGDGKRFKSNTPKPYNKVGNKTLLEHSINEFRNFNQIKNLNFNAVVVAVRPSIALLLSEKIF